MGKLAERPVRFEGAAYGTAFDPFEVVTSDAELLPPKPGGTSTWTPWADGGLQGLSG